MAMQKFSGKVIGLPKLLETANTHRKVMHVRVSFMPDVKLNGKLPEFGEDCVSDIQLSFWDEPFQQVVMAEADQIVGKMITGYCDNVVQRGGYNNATGYAFVIDKNAKPSAPQVQVISKSMAPSAPVAPVA